MSKKQTSKNGEGELTSSQQASLASRFHPQESERERMTTATSGQRLCACLGKFSPLGSLVRTLLVSSRWWSSARSLQWINKPLYSMRVTDYSTTEPLNSTQSKEFAETSKRRDIPSSRSLFQLVPSARPTGETACGLSRDGNPDKTGDLLPTPTTSDSWRPMRAEYGVREDGAVYHLNPKAKKSGATLSEVAHMGLLPTPQALDYKRTERKPSYANKDWDGSTLTDAAYQSRRMMKKHASTAASPVRHGTPSQLNPLFWEEIMGYPVEWTLYPFLTASSERRQ